MKRLIGVEVRRLLARRLVRVLAGAMVIGLLTAGPLVFAKSHRDVAKATAAAREGATAGYAQCLSDPHARAEGCEAPNPDEIVADPRFHLTSLVDVAENVGAALIMLALVAGASFVGADWHHRVVTTTLTWEPRRDRVLLSKLAAVASVAFAGAFVYEILLGAALTPAAVFRGSTDGATAAWFGSLAASILRVGAASALAATIGASIAMIGRATAAALGGLFAWLAVGENIIRGLRPGWNRWLIGDSMGAFVSGGASDEFGRAASTAGTLLLCYALLIVAVAARMFARRDVA